MLDQFGYISILGTAGNEPMPAPESVEAPQADQPDKPADHPDDDAR